MFEKRRLTEDQIAMANCINIVAYAESIGLKLYKTGHSYKVKDYGGLYVDADGRKWNWFSQNKGGGPIQFVMEMEGKSWIDAIYTLLNLDKSEFKDMPKVVSIEERGEFILPSKGGSYLMGLNMRYKAR